MPKQRLDKIIAAAAGISRKDAGIRIRRGEVSVSGDRVCDPSSKADTDNDEIMLGGSALDLCDNHYFMLNKPSGILSASNDKRCRTVVDIISESTGIKGLFPVGRLDKTTTGLLIITDDGDYAHMVISPKKHVEKSYIATLDAPADEEAADGFRSGAVLADGYRCLPARLETVNAEKTECRVIITEGKYHQIKRMFGVYGIGVNELMRERIGGLTLDPSLGAGEFRELDKAEALLVFGAENG